MDNNCLGRNLRLSIHLCVCLYGEPSCKYSIEEAASMTPAYKTRTEPEDVKLKNYERMAISQHPPFRTLLLTWFSFWKTQSPKSSVFTPCETKEWKSETTQIQMVNFKMATMAREISRASFVWRPFTCAPCHRASFLSSSSIGTGQNPF